MSNRTVIIACVAYDVLKITEPARFYSASKVHILHQPVDSEDDRELLYPDFINEVGHRLEDYGMEVVMHPVAIADYLEVLREVNHIIQCEEDSNNNDDLMINISAGTNEYVAAAAIASVLNEGVKMFASKTCTYKVPVEGYRKSYYEDGRPVGIVASVHDPRMIPVFKARLLDEDSIRCLREMDKMHTEGKSTSSKKVIAHLKDIGMWSYVPVCSSKRDNLDQKELMFFQRHYIEKWIDNGWMVKDDLSGKNAITERGRNVVNTFFIDKSI